MSHIVSGFRLLSFVIRLIVHVAGHSILRSTEEAVRGCDYGPGT